MKSFNYCQTAPNSDARCAIRALTRVTGYPESAIEKLIGSAFVPGVGTHASGISAAFKWLEENRGYHFEEVLKNHPLREALTKIPARGNYLIHIENMDLWAAHIFPLCHGKIFDADSRGIWEKRFLSWTCDFVLHVRRV